MTIPYDPVTQKGGITGPGDGNVVRRGDGNRAQSLPPGGEDGVTAGNETWQTGGRGRQRGAVELENEAQRVAESTGEDDADPNQATDDDDDFRVPTDSEFLQMVTAANSQGQFYSNQVNRRAWERAYMAFRQQHFAGSKYASAEFKNRSRLFVPKTRSAVRKDVAAVCASLFSSHGAVSLEAGNDSDPMQKAGAEINEQLINYRTDMSNGKAATPWFLTALGNRQTSLLTGFCVSKQFWRLELRKHGDEDYDDEESGSKKRRDVWKPFIDRPESMAIPPENCTIDPACDWTNPSQDSAYFIIRYPMRIDEILRRQKDPLRPWRTDITADQLRTCGDGAQMEASAIRRARDQGLDRYDEAMTGGDAEFDVIWVSEAFIRTAGDDWTFFTAGNKFMLTDPAPVSEVYPEHSGERPIAMGYGNFEAFCVFPMAAVESWQMLQQEANDLTNLTLDALKQNIMPITKVVRGRQIDLEQLRRRGVGTSIMVNKPDDVTWEQPPQLPAAAQALREQLDMGFDDLAGQQNYNSVANNNSLGETLGGLKLAAGSANAVQELDMRVWTTTWCEPVMRQLVNLVQYYESDQTVIGLCGEKAKLREKYGISEINDELLESNVTTRVSIGYGSGDPQQRLSKFVSGYQAAMPLLQMDPDFKSGKKSINGEAVMAETFGAVGYRDGGKRFVKEGPPQQQPPEMQPQIDKIVSETAKNKAMAKAAVINALSNAAKVGIGLKDQDLAYIQQQLDMSHQKLEMRGKAADLGFQHAQQLLAHRNAARGVGPDGSPLQQTGADDGGGDDGSSGAPPSGQGAAAAAPALAGGPTGPGAGNQPLAPGDVGKQGVPAADAGQQQEQDAVAEQQATAKATGPKSRKITITGRGADGRANQFHVEEA